ncbi:MAG: transposase [Pseudohongiellaceae bacterium]
MPRTARLIVPGAPHHIVHRGHNRQTIFPQPEDFDYYLKNLIEYKHELGIRVYSYCLMSNHVHIIVGAGKNPSDIGRLMKIVAGRHTRMINKREDRTGSLWDGRYYTSPIDTEAYLFTCIRYVELNPVKAGIVSSPAHYQWCSYRARIGLSYAPWLDTPPLFDQLGSNLSERRLRYRKFIENYQEADQERGLVGKAIRRNQPTGDELFIQHTEKCLGRRIAPRPRGRPAKRG